MSKSMGLQFALLLMFAPASLWTQAAVDVEGIEGVQTDGRGLQFVLTSSGERWNILGEKENRFFFSETSKKIMYEDPRLVQHKEIETEADIPGVSKDEESGRWMVSTAEGIQWSVHQDVDSKRFYYHNAELKQTTWDDPRFPAPPTQEPLKIDMDSMMKQKISASKPQMTRVERMKIAAVALVPVMLFILGMAARVYYLHTHYPELLFPTKERKDRRRASSGKFKPQKARGKMSQDGKGGRSANS